MDVWVPQLRPLATYHMPGGYPRTVCGLAAPSNYGYVIRLAEALAWSMTPCPWCFAPRAGVRAGAGHEAG